MNDQVVMELGRNAITVVLFLSAPLLGIALVVGLVVSVFQAVTQINEATLTFVPKIVAIFVAMAIFGPWMLSVMSSYTASLFDFLPSLAR